jgi:hypothetical protein
MDAAADFIEAVEAVVAGTAGAELRADVLLMAALCGVDLSCTTAGGERYEHAA